MRMTLTEMQKKYPNKWLGINKVERDANRALIAANVVFTDKTASELAMMSIKKEDIQPFFTTPDSTFHVGAVS